MVANFLKIAWRVLWRSRSFSFINVIGLGLGISCSLLIMLWVRDEWLTDRFHKNSEYLYSVYSRRFSDGQVTAGHFTPGPLPEELKLIIPEILYACGFDPNSEASLFELGDKSARLPGNYAGEDFFKMFSYPLLHGTPQTALVNTDGIAVSRRMAELFFGSADAAVGKMIRYNRNTELMVTAVFENLPSQASQQFEFLLSWKLLFQHVDWLTSWVYNRPSTYIMLRSDANPVAVETKLKNFLGTYNKEQNKSFHVELGLQRYDQKYLYSHFSNGYPDGGRIDYVKLFSLVAVFILLIACINFMNLSTARSARRSKEVGVRKVAGASRAFLISQFTGEALLITFYAMIISLCLVTMVMPEFNLLTGKQIELPLSTFSFWLSLVILLTITGIISGSYPALYLSALNPVRVLKGSLKFGKGSLLFRKGLVVFQFVISIVMIIATIVVSQQINFVQTKHLGFDKDNLIYVHFEGSLTEKYHVLKQEALRLNGVKDITRMSRPPERILDHGYDLTWAGHDPSERTVIIHVAVGYDFVKTLNLKLLSGRDFSGLFPSDSNSFIINETALQRIGYKDPINQPLSLFGVQGKIIGVVKDFHFNTLHEPIEPLVMRFGEDINWGYAVIRIDGEHKAETLAGLEKICKQLNPGYPFVYHFTDQEYQNLYQSEQVVGKLATGFAFLAIFISSLGLLGLILYTAEQRTKEIGIRKVLGASIASILQLLSKDFVKLIVLSAMLAFPLAWWGISQWLEKFAYKVEVSWTFFAGAALVAFIIAVATIGFHTIKAASMNPVRSLRSE
jgi:putative ABC transport system permease protein